jgi:transposase
MKDFEKRRDAQLVATIPVIGFYGSLLIHAEIDDIRRFPHPEKQCSYAGHVLTVNQLHPP